MFPCFALALRLSISTTFKVTLMFWPFHFVCSRGRGGGGGSIYPSIFNIRVIEFNKASFIRTVQQMSRSLKQTRKTAHGHPICPLTFAYNKLMERQHNKINHDESKCIFEDTRPSLTKHVDVKKTDSPQKIF